MLDQEEKAIWKYVVGAVIVIAATLLLLRVVLLPVWFANRTIDVAQQQYDPAVMLKRYEWFKDASAQLDKKQQDIKNYEERQKSLQDEYKGVSRTQWSREDREQFNQWQSELVGVKSSYNSLAAEYNANMAKFNYNFTNTGDLPKGADRPLPREYRTYQ